MKEKIKKILFPVSIAIVIFLLFAPFPTWFGEKSTDEKPVTNKWVLLSKNTKDVSCLVVDPSNPKTIYAGTYGSGIYRSNNEGKSWKEINTDIENKYIISLAVNPKFPSILYAGTKDVDSLSATVYRSADSGEHWVKTKINSDYKMLANCIVFDNLPVPTIYLCGTGIWYSSDNGASWKKKTSDSCYSFVVDSKNNKIIYYSIYGKNGGIYQLNNGIESKAVKITSLNSPNIDADTILKLVLNPGDSNSLYVSTINNGMDVYYSSNGGEYWKEISKNAGTISNICCLIINPQNGSNVYACDSNNIFNISNDGNTWEVINYNLPKVMINCLAFDSANPNKIYAAIGTSKEKGGIYSLDLPKNSN